LAAKLSTGRDATFASGEALPLEAHWRPRARPRAQSRCARPQGALEGAGRRPLALSPKHYAKRHEPFAQPIR
jgi:hypothetical protein